VRITVATYRRQRPYKWQPTLTERRNSTKTTPGPILKDLTGFQKTVLYVIADLDDPKGVAIKDEIGRDYETEIHHGRLYPNLDELVEKGLIVKGEHDARTPTS